MPRQRDLQKLISRKQRRLQKLKEQEALFGVNTPPETLIQIEDLEEEIEVLQAQLAEAGAETDAPQASPSEQPASGGTVYNIHIDQARGLAIGDGARVSRENEIPGPTRKRKQRCADLSANIRETLDLIKQYEDQRRLADDPKAKRRAEREISNLRRQLAAYEAEARELGCDN